MCYVISVTATKRTAIEDRQRKIRKESKQVTIKNEQNAKEGSKKGKGTTHTKYNEQNGNSKSFPTSNYLSVNGLNYPVKTESG